jgi:succinate dehydrogenase/fumarate reductase flavoprotein subunit
LTNESITDKKLSRRQFVGTAAAGAVALGAVAGATTFIPHVNAAVAKPAQTGPKTTTAPSSTPTQWDAAADVVVAGAGIGGLTAALSAQQAGANVICLEAYYQVGGTGWDSGGGVVAPATLAAAKAQMLYGDPNLVPVFVNNMVNAQALILATGAPCTKVGTGFYTWTTAPTLAQRTAFFSALANYFTENGGTLLLNTKAVQLYTDSNGAIAGIGAMPESGDATLNEGLMNIQAPAVILATGGFQNNPEMKDRYLGHYFVWARSVPTNDGTMTLMAQAIGAKLTEGLGTFYGHTLPAPPAQVKFGDLADHGGSQYYDTFGILVNMDGLRFFNETPAPPGVAGDQMALQIPLQRTGRACVIIDQTIYNNYGHGSPIEGWTGHADRIAYAQSVGGNVASEQTIAALATDMAAWGYNATQVVNTVNAFNAAVAAGTTAALVPPKTPLTSGTNAANGIPISYVNAITTPPFWAVEVCAGVSCDYGGLAINTNTEVLKEGWENIPISGLYAIPGTAGGITQVYYYDSSQGACSAFGYVAGQNAAAYAKKRQTS